MEFVSVHIGRNHKCSCDFQLLCSCQMSLDTSHGIPPHRSSIFPVTLLPFKYFAWCFFLVVQALVAESTTTTLWSEITLHRESLTEAAYYSWGVFSLTLTGLVSAWRRREAPSAILAKPLSDCVTVFCLRQCKIKAFERLWNLEKNACYFQINWISCILNWGVHCDAVSDAGHTCCCSFLLLTFPPPNWRTSLMTKIEVCVRQQI